VNHSRFIELLNLYLDHQLAPEEIVELEAEVLRSAARRRTYNQYCRLQRGCSLLGEQERSSAPASHAFARSLQDVERKISSPPRPFRQPAYMGLIAASAMAACVAVVVMVNHSPSSEASNAAPQTVAALDTKTAPIAAVAPSFELQPVLAASGFGVTRTIREAEIAATDPEVLGWMKRVENLPMQQVVVDYQAFESRVGLHSDNRVFRSRHAIQGNAEFASFQFQR